MKKIFVLLILLLFVFAFGCTQTVEQSSSVTDEKVNISFKYVDGEEVVLIEEEIEATKGINAFDFLKENFEVDYEEYAFGPFVKSFNGMVPSEGEYIALYVNGDYAEKGISEYVLNEDTLIEFRFESVSAFEME
jgi:hypothetical protein